MQVHFLRFWLKTPFASTKFCDLYAEMVQDRQILIFYTIIIVHIANDCGYKILQFWANLQKYQTLVPAKISHIKVHFLNLQCLYVLWTAGLTTVPFDLQVGGV